MALDVSGMTYSSAQPSRTKIRAPNAKNVKPSLRALLNGDFSFSAQLFQPVQEPIVDKQRFRRRGQRSQGVYQRGPDKCKSCYSAPSSRTMATEEEAPMRLAPASSIARTSASLRMPPEALTPQRPPATPRRSATSAAVAPPEAKSVAVLRKSAPA